MVMPAQNARGGGRLSQLVARLLDRDFNREALPVLRAISRTTNSGTIARRMKELDNEVARLVAAGGKRLPPDNAALRALVGDLESVMRGNALLIDGAAGGLQGSGIEAAPQVQRAAASAGLTPNLAAQVRAAWNVPDAEAVARVVQYAGSSAWESQLAAFGRDVPQTIADQAVRGIAQGWGPKRTAARVRELVENMPAHQASTLMRTMQLTSYRDATAVNQQANRAIARRVVRIATLDQRTCLSCISAHGEVLWDGVGDAPIRRVNDHHNGRCTSVVIVKGRNTAIRSGEDWFNGLPRAQRDNLAALRSSPGKRQALASGDVTLRDFRQPYTDKVFGQMLNEASLTDALAKGRSGRRSA